MRKYDVTERPSVDLNGLCTYGMTHYAEFKNRLLSVDPDLSVATDRPPIRFVYSDPPYGNIHGILCFLMIFFTINARPKIANNVVLELGLVEIRKVIVKVKVA